MYKTRNTGMGNGIRKTWGMRGMLYSGIYHQKFRVISSKIPRNVPKHSRDIAKHSGECPQTFQEILPNIPGNVLKHSGECRQTSREMWSNIPGNVVKHSGESC